MEARGDLSATQTKAVLQRMAETGEDPDAIAAAMGLEQIGEDALDATLDAVIAAHTDEWARYREGDEKLAQFFVGQVMRETGGKADGKAVVAGLVRRR